MAKRFYTENKRRSLVEGKLKSKQNRIGRRIITSLERKMCLGKIKYQYYSGAVYALSRHRDKDGVEIYVCRYCKNYHIGHNNKKDKI